MKGKDGKWDTRGHRDRVMYFDRDTLSVIHALSEDQTVPIEESRFIQPYSARTLDVFRQLARFPKLDASIPKVNLTVQSGNGNQTIQVPLWQMSSHWHETGAQKDGTIRRRTSFHDAEHMILQGPLFHVGNPLYKTARRNSRSNADYDVIDLLAAPSDYLPRTNYEPAIKMSEYRQRMARCRWDSTSTHADFFRVAVRRMVNLRNV